MTQQRLRMPYVITLEFTESESSGLATWKQFVADEAVTKDVKRPAVQYTSWREVRVKPRQVKLQDQEHRARTHNSQYNNVYTVGHDGYSDIRLFYLSSSKV